MATAQAALHLREAGDVVYMQQHFLEASDRYAQAARAWQDTGDAEMAASCWAAAGCALLEGQRPYEAVVACERGTRLHPSDSECGLYGALGLELLGLMDAAEERLARGALLDSRYRSDFQVALVRVQRRMAEIESGDGQVLMAEVQRFGALVDEQEGGYWITCVGERSRTAEGRAELVEKGFLKEEHQHLPNPADVARRGSYVALKYRVNKRLQRHLSAAGLLMGLCDECVLPRALRDPAALELATEAACGRLAKDRLMVVDGTFPDALMEAVRGELQVLRRGRLLQNDPSDVCNPAQEARYLPFGGDARSKEFKSKCPMTMEVVRRLSGIPDVLEEELGLRLAVPKSVMAACYPPRASYKMHLDSYAVQGGHEDVPRKVTILLYCNVGWTPAAGGQLRTWAPFDQGRGAAWDISPLPGRLVAFMSEEIWHEVTEAHGERYAITLWAQDRDKAEMAADLCSAG